MSDDGRKKPPPRFPRPVAPPSEDEKVPDTLRFGKISPGPEPFKKIEGRQPSYVEFAAKLSGFEENLAQVLGIQRKMSLQLDGFGQVINRRFDLFHEELALLNATVNGEHAPRLDEIAVEVEEVKKTAGQKAKAGAMVAARFGAWGTGALFFGGLALRALAKLYPEYGQLIESILSAVGL